MAKATQSAMCQGSGSGTSKFHKRSFTWVLTGMGGVDTCHKDLSWEDFLFNCLLSGAQLNRDYYYSWVFWLGEVSWGLFTFLSPKL